VEELVVETSDVLVVAPKDLDKKLVETVIRKIPTTEVKSKSKAKVKSEPKAKAEEEEEAASSSKSQVSKAKPSTLALRRHRKKKKDNKAQTEAEMTNLRHQYLELVNLLQEPVPVFVTEAFTPSMGTKQRAKKRSKASSLEEAKNRKREQDKVSARIYRQKVKYQEEVIKQEMDFYKRVIPQLKYSLKQKGGHSNLDFESELLAKELEEKNSKIIHVQYLEAQIEEWKTRLLLQGQERADILLTAMTQALVIHTQDDE
jgi:hypothetical protein